MGNVALTCPDRHTSCVPHTQSSSLTLMNLHCICFRYPPLLFVTLHILRPNNIQINFFQNTPRTFQRFTHQKFCVF